MKDNVQQYPKSGFTRLLLKWNRNQNTRQMPWKGEKDPYKIWLSEIILQQTRVEQGLNYYNRFIRVFPDIQALAEATDEKIYKLWEGLGYYTRCRNLITTARYIVNEHKAIFPRDYETIRALKGIGPYTAAAISSFAFNLPYAVVDGNVFRVLSRFFGIAMPIDSPEGKKIFTHLAGELLDKEQPGVYNQAIMDFGAVICKPVPLCNNCVFNKTCYAFLHGKTGSLPVKEKQTRIRKRGFYYFILEHKGKIAIRQRLEKDIWQQLFEFPLIELVKAPGSKQILLEAQKRNWLQKMDKPVAISPLFKQQLSHQLITGKFILVRLRREPRLKNDWTWVARNKLGRYAFPQFIRQYLQSIATNPGPAIAK